MKAIRTLHIMTPEERSVLRSCFFCGSKTSVKYFVKEEYPESDTCPIIVSACNRCALEAIWGGDRDKDVTVRV